MKVLKSGIEMTLEELRSLKGGTCACACQPGFNSATLNVDGDSSSACACGCISAPYSGSASSATRRIGDPPPP